MKYYIHREYLDGQVTECNDSLSAMCLLFAVIAGKPKAIKVDLDLNGYDHYYIFKTLDI